MAYLNFVNGTTAVNDTNLNAMQKGLIQLVFPVGSTYITQANTNPSTILGFGTWERLKGKVCLGLDENDSDFNSIKKTGGNKEHQHKQTLQFASEYISSTGVKYTEGDTVPAGEINTQEASNIMPYEVVGYMWIRRS